MNIYEENGYASRGEYLDAMAEDYGLEKSDVRLLADLLGPSEDFDGLISGLEEMQDMKARYQEEHPRHKSPGKKTKSRHGYERVIFEYLGESHHGDQNSKRSAAAQGNCFIRPDPAAASMFRLGCGYGRDGLPGPGPVLGKETASWVCILAAAPFAVAGFFQYNGLTFGQFLWAVLKSQVLYAGPRVFRAENLYCAALSRKGKPYDTEDR